MQPDKKTILSTKNIHNNIIYNNNNNNKQPIIPQPPRSQSSAAQACAACKHQRRKCTPDCVLAPYFPHDRQRQFLNAHRLFGVSNIVKIVKNLQPQIKDHAMRTIIFQSDARAADPVGGCYRIIRELEQRIGFASAELHIVLHHLAICRATAQQAATEGRETRIGWDVFENNNDNNEKWKEQFANDDVSSWGCVSAHNNQADRTAESMSSYNIQVNAAESISLPNLVNVSLDDCTGGINGNLGRLSCDDAKGVLQI